MITLWPMSTAGSTPRPASEPVSGRARLLLVVSLVAAAICTLIIAGLIFFRTPLQEHSSDAAASHGPNPAPGNVIASRIFVGADDFVVDVFHNGEKVPIEARSMTAERFGAIGERIDTTVREGDWIVFNVVNNRLRWNGALYFGAAGVRDDGAIGFNSEESPLWSVCEDPGLVPRFIAEPGFMATNVVRRIETPWSGGDKMIRSQVADWSGYAIWGDPTNRNIWIKFHARPQR
jgi:hypothetical protein